MAASGPAQVAEDLSYYNPDFGLLENAVLPQESHALDEAASVLDFELNYGASEADVNGRLEDPYTVSSDSLFLRTSLPEQAQLEREFQVSLARELPHPTIAELDQAVGEFKRRNYHRIGTASNLPFPHGPGVAGASNVIGSHPQSSLAPPTLLTNMQTAQQQAAVNQVDDSPNLAFTPVDYTSHRSTNGLIRDAHPPHADDYSEGALVYRVAASAAGRRTNFTFVGNYHHIVRGLRRALRRKLNQKLEADLPNPNAVLLRNMPLPLPGQFINMWQQDVIIFSQTASQRRINWRDCPEHYGLLKDLDFAKPDLGIEELDALVKKAGVWVFDTWQAAHPGQERHAY